MNFQIVTRILFFLLFSLSFSVYGQVHYICESSHQSNGATKLFSKSLEVSFNSPIEFESFQAKTLKNRIALKKKNFYISSSSGNFKIDLAKLKKDFQTSSGDNLTLWFKFYPAHHDTGLEISPYFLSNTKIGAKFPKAKVLFYKPGRAIHKSIGLPFDAHFVKSASTYIEYSYKNGMINRIEKSAKSSYQKISHVCIKENKEQIPFVRGNYKDITTDIENWPSELNPLKESLAQILFDRIAMGEKKNFSTLERVILNDALLLRLIQESTVKFVPEVYRNILENIDFFKKEQGKSIAGAKLFFRSHQIGKQLYSAKLDTSNKAYSRNAYSPNKSLNMDPLDYVTITKQDKNFYFYFHNESKDFNLQVGPIDLTKIMWKYQHKDKSLCVQRMMQHYSEYERKSFIFESLSTSLKSLFELSMAREYKSYPISNFILTNNCRGLGNFEYEIPGIIKGYFQVPTSILTKNIPELDWENIYTEVRPTDFYLKEFENHGVPNQSLKDKLVSIWSKYFEDNYNWKKLSNFEKLAANCNANSIIEEFSSIKGFKEVKSFKRDLGEIDYERFLHETRKKSGDVGEYPALSYVKTPCGVNKSKPPYSFRAPKHLMGMSGREYWEKGTCEWVSHQFHKYDEINKYQIGLSGFEVDGVYTGHSYNRNDKKMKNFEDVATSDKNRMPFDYTLVNQLSKLNYKINGNKLDLVLSNKDQSFNLFIGGIDLGVLKDQEERDSVTSIARPWYIDNFKGIYSLIGITPYPLASYYEKKPLQDVVSFFYDKNHLLNHHLRHIGIEQWYITKKGNTYTIDLLSHERIMPIYKASFVLE